MKSSKTASECDALGLYLREVARYRPLTPREESHLAARARKGDRRALGMLIRANLRFVVSVARNYRNQGVALCDLINEGNLGLIRAAKRFDETKNFKFISYAVWWIRQAILHVLADQSRIVKIPLNRAGVLYKLGQAEDRLTQRLRRKPTREEIARDVAEDRRAVEDAFRIGLPHLSLEQPLLGSEDRTLEETLPDFERDPPDSAVEEESSRIAIRDLLGMLDERERMVLQMYYGLDRDRAHTLDEIGRNTGLTRERIRQIRDRALRKLRDRKGLQQYHELLA